ncbi:hypothetical protein [Streptomyces sp. HUAS ZL42]|uniref:hypothetical protein n=1 Tax=Streptomyces sp. HUAS ZL42 TaxID=3231715 RepID=UPI00345F0B00
MRSSRIGRWAAAAVVPAFAVLSLTVGPRFLEDVMGIGTDEVAGSAAFAGAWKAGLDEDSPLVSIRLDVLPGARAGEKGATVLSATRDTVCSGRATVKSRSEDTLVLGGFDMRRIGPGATSGSYACGLPATMKLVSDPHGGIMWEPAALTSVEVDRALPASVQVPDAFLGEWYASRGSLQVTVRRGAAGSLAVHGVDERDGRHCEWEAALLDVGRRTIATTGAHVIKEESDAACASANHAYLYDIEGSGDTATLSRHSDAEPDALTLRRRP